MLKKSLKLFKDQLEKLFLINSITSYVTHKNVGLKILKNISNILSGITMNTELEPGLPEDFSTDDLIFSCTLSF
jgi:hypothetical protein